MIAQLSAHRGGKRSAPWDGSQQRLLSVWLSEAGIGDTHGGGQRGSEDRAGTGGGFSFPPPRPIFLSFFQETSQWEDPVHQCLLRFLTNRSIIRPSTLMTNVLFIYIFHCPAIHPFNYPPPLHPATRLLICLLSLPSVHPTPSCPFKYITIHYPYILPIHI